METTLEAVEAIKEDQYTLEEMIMAAVMEFEKKHGVVVVGFQFHRYNVSQMGSEAQTLLSRILALVAITPELANERR